METVLANAVGKIRKEQMHGRDYLVAPATLIVPGVLNGSRGKLFYPPEEVAKDPWAWNGVPLVGYHPTRNGEHVSGRDPDVLNHQGLGFLYRAKANGKLTGEAWFDVHAVENFDKKLDEKDKILPRLTGNQPIELSTGLMTENEPAISGSTYNGQEYDFIARNYRPDHLAILPDQKGACSLNDGCGINVNAACPECKAEMNDGKCEKCQETYNATVDIEVFDFIENEDGVYEVANLGNPKSLNTGKFKKKNAGFGKGDVHEAAQSGAQLITEQHKTLGAIAAEQIALGNDTPTWATDQAKWERAKATATKVSRDGDWPFVASVYQGLGGVIVDNCGGPGSGVPGPCAGASSGSQDISGGVGDYGVRDSHYGGTPKVKQAMKDIEQGPMSHIASMTHKDATKEIESVLPLHEKHLEELKKIASAKSEPKGMDETNWRHAEAKSGKVIPAHEWASKLAVPQKEQYIQGIHSAAKSLKTIRSHAEKRELKKQTGNQSHSGVTTMTRNEIIQHLVTNCDCWKGGEKTLATLNDQQLVKLKANTDTLGELRNVVNAMGAPDGLTVNAMPAFIKEKIDAKKAKEDKEEVENADDEEEEEEEEMPVNKKKSTANAKAVPLTERLTPAEREVWDNAVRIVANEKAQIVQALTANIADAGQKKATAAVYNAMGVDALRTIAATIPQPAREQPRGLFYGAAAGPVENYSGEQDDALDVMVINWNEKESA